MQALTLPLFHHCAASDWFGLAKILSLYKEDLALNVLLSGAKVKNYRVHRIIMSLLISWVMSPVCLSGWDD